MFGYLKLGGSTEFEGGQTKFGGSIEFGKLFSLEFFLTFGGLLWTFNARGSLKFENPSEFSNLGEIQV